MTESGGRRRAPAVDECRRRRAGMVRGDPHPRRAGADAELKWGYRWMASPSLPAGARCHGVRTMSNSSHAWRGGVLGGRAPGNLPRTWGDGCRTPASFRADGRAPPRSAGMVRDVARRRRGRGFGSRRAGALEDDRALRAREAPRAILDREVGTAQPDGQPASRAMHYQHGISGDGAGRPPTRDDQIQGRAAGRRHDVPQTRRP